ncbi:MAG TPA: hypothetical protein VE604_09330 [Candidatus Polarisedimenticolia bacterium]|nr:hypothetical protein [Candidatus Polarisedimenticolia bacterium]
MAREPTGTLALGDIAAGLWDTQTEVWDKPVLSQLAAYPWQPRGPRDHHLRQGIRHRQSKDRLRR